MIRKEELFIIDNNKFYNKSTIKFGEYWEKIELLKQQYNKEIEEIAKKKIEKQIINYLWKALNVYKEFSKNEQMIELDQVDKFYYSHVCRVFDIVCPMLIKSKNIDEMIRIEKEYPETVFSLVNSKRGELLTEILIADQSLDYMLEAFNTDKLEGRTLEMWRAGLLNGSFSAWDKIPNEKYGGSVSFLENLMEKASSSDYRDYRESKKQ